MYLINTSLSEYVTFICIACLTSLEREGCYIIVLDTNVPVQLISVAHRLKTH